MSLIGKRRAGTSAPAPSAPGPGGGVPAGSPHLLKMYSAKNILNVEQLDAANTPEVSCLDLFKRSRLAFFYLDGIYTKGSRCLCQTINQRNQGNLLPVRLISNFATAEFYGKRGVLLFQQTSESFPIAEDAPIH